MNLQGTRVLIIEDDPIVAMAANGMVKELGGLVAGTASSVAAGEEKIRNTDFGCVMLDINLRGEMALGIAAELEARKMPYVFCMVYSQTFDGFEHAPRVTNLMASTVLLPVSAKPYQERMNAHQGSSRNQGGPLPIIFPMATSTSAKS